MAGKIPKPYDHCFGSDSKPCVTGPGNGPGYHAGTLWPHLRLSTEADAKAAAELCNIAFAEGYKQAQWNIRKAMGV